MRRLVGALLAVTLVAGSGSALTDSRQEMLDEAEQSVVYISMNNAEGKQFGVCSGSVFDAIRGYILTNKHCLIGATHSVMLRDGRAFDAVIVGEAPDEDVALLQIDAPDLRELPRANSNYVRVRDEVWVLGHPLNLRWSWSRGIVSAVGRFIKGGSDWKSGRIQTDAAVNGGNSGGVLLNRDGFLIGIPTSALATSDAGGSIGLNFCISINAAVDAVKGILKRAGK